MKTIYLVTHTEASHTTERKVGGWYDSALTPAGEAQAGRLRQILLDIGFIPEQHRTYSSDLKRAAQTAGILLSHASSQLTLDARLREMSFGTHEGMSQQAHNKIMRPISSTNNRLDHKICEGAESRRDVALRTSQFMQEEMIRSGDALVVTHGFAATFVIAAFLNIAINNQGHLAFDLKPGSIVRLQEDDLFMNRAMKWIH